MKTSISAQIVKINADKSQMKSISLLLYYLFARKLPISFHYGLLGKFARFFRFITCSCIFQQCGKNVNIEQGVRFGNGRGVKIGDYSGIGIDCQIPAVITIGKYVMMGPEVMIIGQNHDFSEVSRPMMFQGYKEISEVVIEDDVWIGARVIILPGVRVGKGSIIGTGAVVTKDITPYSICGGNPARVIRSRLAHR